VNRTEKQKEIDGLKDDFARANMAVVAQYKGLTVAQVTDLRTELRKVDGRFKVVKNTMARRAIAEAPAEGLTDHFRGPVGVVFAYGDAAAAAKVLRAFGKGAELFVVSAGLVEGAVIDARGVAQIADLPGRQELLARLAGALNDPIRGLATVLAGPARGLVYALAAVAKKKAA
jgi:large subunit ribosomal protein L10